MDEDLIDLYWPDPCPSSRKALEITEQFEEQASSSHSLPSLSKEGSDRSNLLKKRNEHMEKELLLKMQQITFQKEFIKLDLEQAQLSMEIAKSKREAVEAELMEKYGEVPMAIDKETPCTSSKQEKTGALGKNFGLPNTLDKAIGKTEVSVNLVHLATVMAIHASRWQAKVWISRTTVFWFQVGPGVVPHMENSVLVNLLTP